MDGSVGTQREHRISAAAGGAARVIRTGWRRHPGVRSGDQLTLGERSADRMRNSMGSWAFVFGACGFLAVWMIFNVVLDQATGRTFDPYPFILLNLVLSCVAALQGAILLIAAKRSDQISSELAQHDYQADIACRELLESLTANFTALQQQHEDMRVRLVKLAELVETRVGAAGDAAALPAARASAAVSASAAAGTAEES
jgi:uncharacterized membrane protein